MGYYNGKKVITAVKTETVYGEVDQELSTTSENPVQNKVVTKELNKKAYTEDIEDGRTIAGKSITAKAIENVSEESGTVQEEPFIMQGTGTNNNTESVDTSPVAKQLEKQGNSIVYNQLANTPTASNEVNGITYTANADGSMTANGTATADSYYVVNYVSSGLIAGHKYLLQGCPSGGSSNTYFLVENTNYVSDTGNGRIWAYSGGHAGNKTLVFNVKSGVTVNNLKVYFQLIDLTQWFNGDIPQDLLDNPSHFSWSYNGDLSYNTGEIKDCAGRYLICGGRNVWDEVATETGYISDSGNVVTGYGARIASTNFIRVIPNTDYYFRFPYPIASMGMRIAWYDKDKTLIAVIDGYTAIQKSPSNAVYLRFNVSASGYASSTYRNDITISLYYSTGDGYDQYYPYEAPKTYDTGVEVLRKAGSIKDSKAADGTITRRVGSVDLGTLTWAAGYAQSGSKTYYAFFTQAVLSAQSELPNFSTVNYTRQIYTNRGIDKSVACEKNSHVIIITDSSYNDAATFKAAMDGVILYYELATPTTEEGTPFSENIEINDYGTMAFKDTDEEFIEIPQGVKVFYPADYVLFIDSLVKETNGDASAIALKNDLLPKLPSASANGTYVLKAVKSGDTITYSWVAEE